MPLTKMLKKENAKQFVNLAFLFSLFDDKEQFVIVMDTPNTKL